MRKSLEQTLWHSCYRKKAFRSPADAHMARKQMGFGRKGMTVYQCQVCGLWHLARKKGEPT
jgi:5-methylcytosine-specific restriction endonuclease McrA